MGATILELAPKGARIIDLQSRLPVCPEAALARQNWRRLLRPGDPVRLDGVDGYAWLVARPNGLRETAVVAVRPAGTMTFLRVEARLEQLHPREFERAGRPLELPDHYLPAPQGGVP